MPSRTQELKIGIGYHRQAGTGVDTVTPTQLQTALAAGSLWNLNINAFNTPFPQFEQESDAEFFGKGHEWVEQIFPTSIQAPWEWPSFLTSQNFAEVIAFALGTITESSPGAGAYQYICTPLDPVTDGVNLPATTIVAGIRQGTAGEIIDQALIGVVCAGFTVSWRRGPGLQNSQIVSRWFGSGKFASNSGIAVPTRYDEERLGSGSLTEVTINGVNYITNARLVDVEFTFDNDADRESNFFPGSGSQSGFDIRGRMRCGRRSASLVWRVELESTSAELAALLAGTEGATTLKAEGSIISGAIKHTAQIYLPRTRHRAFVLEEADGFTAARVETDILYDATEGPMILTAITNKAEIGAEP